MTNNIFEKIYINNNDEIDINNIKIIDEFNNNKNQLNILFNNYNELKQINILNKLINYNKYYSINDYKIINNFIISKIIKNYNKIEYKNIVLSKLLKLICKLKDINLLLKLDFIFTQENIDKYILYDLVLFTSYNCTLYIFIFILEKYINYSSVNNNIMIMDLNKKIINNKTNTDIKELYLIIKDLNIFNILYKSFYNIDDRIYKYILNNYINKYIIENNNCHINLIIKTLSELNNPIKYILRKFKYLSNYINFNNNNIYSIIYYFTNIQIIYNIHKYYYNKPHDSKILLTIINNNDNDNNNIIYYNNIYDLLLTEKEKIEFKLFFKLKYNLNLKNSELKNSKFLKNIIIDNYIIIISLLDNNNIINNNNILKIIIDNNLLNLYYINNIHNINNNNNKLLLFTRFLQINNNNKIIYSINYCLHKLRLLLKKKFNNKINEHNYKFFNILKEIKNYEPNIKIPVLMNGSINYQYKKQQFNNILPRYLLPYEIYNYNSFLLKEKVESILVNILPFDIFPIINFNKIKAEYIEDLDLYLIIDINIPDTTIIERYNILRELHPYTKNLKLQNIENIDNFYNIAKNERLNLEKFLKENKKKIYKWYPKFICNYISNINNNIFYKNIINDIILNNNNNLNNLNLYKCNGIILTPLTNFNEIKIKPLKLITINLLYLNNNWYDEENNIYNNNIKIINNQINNLNIRQIYKCNIELLNNNIYYIPTEIIYNKRNPDTYNIINKINNIIKYNWEQEV
jgi:hypothetical protein